LGVAGHTLVDKKRGGDCGAEKGPIGNRVLTKGERIVRVHFTQEGDKFPSSVTFAAAGGGKTTAAFHVLWGGLFFPSGAKKGGPEKQS